MNIRLAPIGDFVESVRTWNPATAPGSDFLYVDLSSVDQIEKQIKYATLVRGSEAPSRARQLIKKGDILVSTVRPNLNGVAAVTDVFDGATASTGFCVLRPRREKLSSNYLMHWVRAPQFIEQMVREATGASYPAVSDRIIKASHIPLPPPSEQRRIAAILDKADALHRKRKHVLDMIDSLSQSIFHEMFGEWIKVGKHFIAFGEAVEEFRYGTSNKSSTTGHPVLRIPNVIGGQIDLSDLKTVPLEQREFQRLSMQDGDLLLVRTNGNPEYVGRCAVADMELERKSKFSIHQYVYASYLIRARIRQDIFNPYFVQAFLSSPSGRKALLERSKTSAGQFNINTEGLGSIMLPAPNPDLQNKFASRVLLIRRYVASSLALTVKTKALFSSLQHRAFSGELS